MLLDDLVRIGDAVRSDDGLLEQLRFYRLSRYEARQGESA
jgi:hypothetical protein